MKILYKVMAMGLLLFSLLGNVIGENVTWTGAVSSDWADPANWAVGDSIDQADGVSGVYIDSLSMWVKEWDPSIGQYYFTGSDGETEYMFNWDIYIPAGAAYVCSSTWETPNQFNSKLSGGYWTRAGFLKVEEGAELIWGFKNWHTNYIDLDGTVTLTDTSYMRAAKSYSIGRDGGCTLFLNDTSTMDSKSGYYIGRIGTEQVIEGNDTTDVPFSYVGKIIVNDKAQIFGTAGAGFDLRTANGSQLIVNGGTANGFVRDLSSQVTAQVVVNAGEFRCTNDYLSVFLALGTVIVSENGGDLSAVEVDANEDGTTDYVSITNSLNTPIDYEATTAVPYIEQEELEVNIYPNPAVGGIFNVEVPTAEDVQVTIYNAVGQNIFSQSYFQVILK